MRASGQHQVAYTGAINATHNYWSSSVDTEIRARIRDKYDNATLLEVLYAPAVLDSLALRDGKCELGWSLIDDTCYTYVGAYVHYAQAERLCASMEARVARETTAPIKLPRFRKLARTSQFDYEAQSYRRMWLHTDSVASSQQSQKQQQQKQQQQQQQQQQKCAVVDDYGVAWAECARDTLPFICEKDPVFRGAVFRFKDEMAFAIAALAALVVCVAALGVLWLCKSTRRKKQHLARQSTLRTSARTHRHMLNAAAAAAATTNSQTDSSANSIAAVAGPTTTAATAGSVSGLSVSLSNSALLNNAPKKKSKSVGAANDISTSDRAADRFQRQNPSASIYHSQRNQYFVHKKHKTASAAEKAEMSEAEYGEKEAAPSSLSRFDASGLDSSAQTAADYYGGANQGEGSLNQSAFSSNNNNNSSSIPRFTTNTRGAGGGGGGESVNATTWPYNLYDGEENGEEAATAASNIKYQLHANENDEEYNDEDDNGYDYGDDEGDEDTVTDELTDESAGVIVPQHPHQQQQQPQQHRYPASVQQSVAPIGGAEKQFIQAKLIKQSTPPLVNRQHQQQRQMVINETTEDDDDSRRLLVNKVNMSGPPQPPPPPPPPPLAQQQQQQQQATQRALTTDLISSPLQPHRVVSSSIVTPVAIKKSTPTFAQVQHTTPPPPPPTSTINSNNNNMANMSTFSKSITNVASMAAPHSRQQQQHQHQLPPSAQLPNRYSQMPTTHEVGQAGHWMHPPMDRSELASPYTPSSTMYSTTTDDDIESVQSCQLISSASLLLNRGQQQHSQVREARRIFEMPSNKYAADTRRLALAPGGHSSAFHQHQHSQAQTQQHQAQASPLNPRSFMQQQQPRPPPPPLSSLPVHHSHHPHTPSMTRATNNNNNTMQQDNLVLADHPDAPKPPPMETAI